MVFFLNYYFNLLKLMEEIKKLKNKQDFRKIHRKKYQEK